MGKIQKLREQKKQEALEKGEQTAQRNKQIIIWSVVALAVISGLIYGAVLLVKNQTAPSPSATPSVSTTPPQLFPSTTPMTENSTSTQSQELNTVVIETARGDIKLQLYPAAAPKTVANFKKLIGNGFYNGLTFHRVVAGFVVQGGDPKGDGSGGPGYTFEDEINPWSLGLDETTIQQYEAQGYKYTRDLTSYKMTVGALAMANSGPNTNGSQFFIVMDQDQPHLNGKHTVFGKVTAGMDVVRKIQQGDVMKKVSLISK